MERQSSHAKAQNYVGTRQRPSLPSRKAHLRPVTVLGRMAWQDGLQTLNRGGWPLIAVLYYCIPGPEALACRVIPFLLWYLSACFLCLSVLKHFELK